MSEAVDLALLTRILARPCVAEARPVRLARWLSSGAGHGAGQRIGEGQVRMAVSDLESRRAPSAPQKPDAGVDSDEAVGSTEIVSSGLADAAEELSDPSAEKRTLGVLLPQGVSVPWSVGVRQGLGLAPAARWQRLALRVGSSATPSVARVGARAGARRRGQLSR